MKENKSFKILILFVFVKLPQLAFKVELRFCAKNDNLKFKYILCTNSMLVTK